MLNKDANGARDAMKQQMMYRLEALLLGLAIAMIYAAPVFAQANVATQSAVYVERVSGADTRRLEPALQLSRGDRVITLVNWYRVGGRGSFTITNPLPRAVAYQSSTWDNQEVSVDGGRTWGRLGELRGLGWCKCWAMLCRMC